MGSSRIAATNRPKDLKILIVSTPKTGNTWLKCLLARAYDLPLVEFPTPEFWLHFDRGRFDSLGSTWIAHQHFPPLESFVSWARERGIVLVTTVRHPGDTLVSLYHYIQNFAGKTQIDPETIQLLRCGKEDQSQSSSLQLTKRLETYVREKFFKALNFSIAWLERGLSYGVRYEDLWHSPVKTFEALTNQIHPISLGVVEAAVKKCRLEQMRMEVGEDALFFRSGGVAGWESSLPPSIIRLLREVPPYPLQFKWLGYSLDPQGTFSEPPATSTASTILVDEVACSASADRVAPLMTSSHLRGDRAPKGHWKFDLEAAPPDNKYYSWLNAAADDDPHAGRLAPLITNLGAYLYGTRADLQAAFPDLYGSDRVAFSHWFTEINTATYRGLDRCFLIPVYDSWLRGPPPKFTPVHFLRKERAV